MAMIDMQLMRYINLLRKITKVRTSKCFVYNNVIIFAVPSRFLSKAIGPAGKYIKEMHQKLGKRIRIIEEPKSIDDIEKFVEDVVDPVDFSSLEIVDDEIIITAGARNKAALLGRNKRRYLELKQIVEDNFGKELKIV